MFGRPLGLLILDLGRLEVGSFQGDVFVDLIFFVPFDHLGEGFKS